jgi:DNA-binding CsgD family transcriptional regulator
MSRDTGALGVLSLGLNSLASLRVHEGNLDVASRLLDEADAITAATGNVRIVFGRLLFAAWRGDVEAEGLRGDERERVATARGEGLLQTVIDFARALLHNGLGHYETAFAAAQRVSAEEDELSVSSWSLPELVEAAVRSGRPVIAAEAVERLLERTRAAGTDLALGIEDRSRALISEGARAEELYRDAIDRLGHTRMRLYLARAQLVYGEWLRRENRRIKAREQLRHAYDLFAGSGANGFAERARRELLATGETVRTRTDDTRGQLTTQEEQIARLAGDGHTNPEIGAQLFLSPRTVEWHLRKVFAKLGITSRRELRTARSRRGAACGLALQG